MRILVVLLLLVAACGAGPVDGEQTGSTVGKVAFESPAAVSQTSSTAAEELADQFDVPEPSVSRPTGPYAHFIEFEVAWLCDVQRFTYDSPGAVDEALAAGLSDAGLDRDAYDEFKVNLSADPEVRTQILDLFVADCS